MGSWPAIVHLTGPPGVGKLTVATAVVEEAARRGHHAVLLDNHRTANLVFHVLDVDGVRPIPTEVWTRVSEIREAIFRTIEEFSPPEWSFVLTNVVVADLPSDLALVRRLRVLAASRSSTYVPVELRCDTDELLRRVDRPDRKQNMKWIDPTAVREFLDTRELFVPEGSLTVDTTAKTPTESATDILDELAG